MNEDTHIKYGMTMTDMLATYKVAGFYFGCMDSKKESVNSAMRMFSSDSFECSRSKYTLSTSAGVLNMLLKC